MLDCCTAGKLFWHKGDSMKTKKNTKPKTKTRVATKKKPVKKTAAPKKAAKKKSVIKKPALKPKKKTAPAIAKKKKTAKPAKAVAVRKVARPAPSKAKASKTGRTRDKLLQIIRGQLLEQREALLAGAENALNTLPGQTLFPDLGDQASAEIDRDFLLRLKGREQRLLKKIDDAVDRIDNGTFGICEDCGNEIGIKRLLARPVTTMCIECKTLQEEEERRREV